MIRAFKQMVDEGLTDWQLRLAGSVEPGPVHEQYFQKVISAIQGYPITVDTNIPFDNLKQLLGESSIYWHATGYGVDPQKAPEKMEHFGITTVEAMMSRCVPVAINLGGQPEIVTTGKTGFLWDSVEELMGFTWKLIQQPELLDKMSTAAQIDAQKYDDSIFFDTLRRLIFRYPDTAPITG